MRNKSRKRILHEQRVEIARLNRAVENLLRESARARWSYDATKTIYCSQIVKTGSGRDDLESFCEHESERIIRDIVRNIVSANVVQITTDEMPEFGAKKVTFKLKFLVPDHTDIQPAEAFKNVNCIDFREPEILFGGPKGGVRKIAQEDGYGLMNPFRRGD